MPLHIKRQGIATIFATKLDSNKIISTVQSCPSLQAIVEKTTLN